MSVDGGLRPRLEQRELKGRRPGPPVRLPRHSKAQSGLHHADLAAYAGTASRRGNLVPISLLERDRRPLPEPELGLRLDQPPHLVCRRRDGSLDAYLESDAGSLTEHPLPAGPLAGDAIE